MTRIIRYALETHDPWLARLVRRAEAREEIAESLQELDTTEDDPSDEKIVALAELICRRGDEQAIKSAALVVLMSALENAIHLSDATLNRSKIHRKGLR